MAEVTVTKEQIELLARLALKKVDPESAPEPFTPEHAKALRDLLDEIKALKVAFTDVMRQVGFIPHPGVQSSHTLIRYGLDVMKDFIAEREQVVLATGIRAGLAKAASHVAHLERQAVGSNDAPVLNNTHKQLLRMIVEAEG
jgi:hypothetical protein